MNFAGSRHGVITVASIMMLGSTTPCWANDNAGGQSQSTAENAVTTAAIQGRVSQTQLIDEATQRRVGFACVTHTDGQTVVVSVRHKSPAEQSGLVAGDKILKVSLNRDVLQLSVARRGRQLNIGVKQSVRVERPTSLHAEKATLDKLSAKPFELNAEKFSLEDNLLRGETGAKVDSDGKAKSSIDRSNFSISIQKNAELLAKFNIALIVDRSLSMMALDCPQGLSRWEWCGQQADGLARALAPFSPGGFTLIPFATEYDIFEHATQKSVDYIFGNIGLQGGTRLYEPLAESLDTYFARYKPGTKPLLIAIVTDGVPVPRIEEEQVRQELVSASGRMTGPQQVTVVFCQIGSHDIRGTQYLADLSQNLRSYGAKYQYVHTVPFAECVGQGLGASLVRSIKTYYR